MLSSITPITDNNIHAEFCPANNEYDCYAMQK